MTRDVFFMGNSKRSLPWLLATVVAIAAVLLMFLPASAATGGDTPDSAVPLADEGNQGHLEPFDQHWFILDANKAGPMAQVEKSLTLVLTPGDGNIVRFVTLKIFEEGQIARFSGGDTSNMESFGAGQVVSRDDNPETGEQFWTGWISNQKPYYVQVINESDFPVDYWLFSEDISSFLLGEEPAPQIAAEPEATMLPQAGVDPGNPDSLSAGTVTQGTLQPNSTRWYSFKFSNFETADRFKNLDYSLFFTPDDGNRRHHVNFELYPASEYEIWRRGDGDQMTNFGAGRLVSRDGDYNTGERIWRGTVLFDNEYLMAVENNSDSEVDFSIFEDDVYTPELGPKTVPAPPPVFAQGEAPQSANPLTFGENKGGLEPGEEAWYSFLIADFDTEDFEEMALTMVTTPDNGNRIRQMVFDVFTADGVKYWSPGDNSMINNLGAGSVVYRDDNAETGERVWKGWVVDNDRYYVQIRNGTDTHMDYWLYTGDVYGPELGQKTTAVARVAAAPGTSPGSAVDLAVGTNQGHLKPNEERWYVFSRSDVDQLTGSIDTAFTLVFTPDDGNRVRDVNFELFEGNQLRDWSPDSRFNIKNFGHGSVVSRDDDLETGELLWKGQVLAGNEYYMRVSNETDVPLDYSIFPDDVIRANLNP